MWVFMAGATRLGAGRGQRDGGQHVVGLTVGQLGDDVGRGRGDEHQICRVGKADMGHVVLEVAVKRIDLAAAAGQRLKHQRRDKLGGVFRHKNMYIRAQLDECMRHVGHFVGGNAPVMPRTTVLLESSIKNQHLIVDKR